jgi:hypothetical protein
MAERRLTVQPDTTEVPVVKAIAKTKPTSPGEQVWIGGHCVPPPPKPIHPAWVKKVMTQVPPVHQMPSHPSTGNGTALAPVATTAPEDYGPDDPVLLPEEPYCLKSHDAIEHFLGPWSLIAVGRDGDGGWAAVRAYIDVGIKGSGEPFDKWNDVEDIRARAWDWASFHDKETQAFLGPKPTWTICFTATDEDMERSVHHFHSGN